MIDKLGDKPVWRLQKLNIFLSLQRIDIWKLLKRKFLGVFLGNEFGEHRFRFGHVRKCGNKEYLFSRKDIIERAIELPDGHYFELHRPWIDKIKIMCLKCKENMDRELFVLDTWHNSGASPYASFTDE